MTHLILAALVMLMTAHGAQAMDFNTALQTYLQSRIMDWAQDPTIVQAIKAQNAMTADYDAGRIEALDQAWRAEIGAVNRPTITPVIESATAEFLRKHVAASDGAMTEVFVMDSIGLTVASSEVTSDYWQGDEAKHLMTYGKGAGAVHFGDIEFDESSQKYQAQISLSLIDPDTGVVIGAMTVGVNADSLM